MPKKKGKKGQKGKVRSAPTARFEHASLNNATVRPLARPNTFPCFQAGPEIVTTGLILKERARCLCPRFGDAYYRTEKADLIKNDVAFYRINKVASKGLVSAEQGGKDANFALIAGH